MFVLFLACASTRGVSPACHAFQPEAQALRPTLHYKRRGRISSAFQMPGACNPLAADGRTSRRSAHNMLAKRYASKECDAGKESALIDAPSPLDDIIASKSSVSSEHLSTTDFVSEADRRLAEAATSIESALADAGTTNDADSLANRRRFMGSVLLSAGVALGGTTQINTNSVANAAESFGSSSATISSLQYEASPVNKRYGVSLYDAEKSGFNVKFITYLSRFLLVFDRDCQRWWYQRAGDIPATATIEEVNEKRLKQFASFSASVEVGLLEYRDPKGPKRLLKSMLERYCPNEETLRKMREESGDPLLNPAAEARQQREIKEARRQIALLFGLMDQYQPVEEITTLLAAIDNATVTSVVVTDPGSGYAPGYGSPLVTFPPPEAGEDFPTATGRAVLRPSGRLLRIDLVDRGQGYTSPPKVSISPPNTANVTDASPARARAFIFREGPNKGKIERIQLDDPGRGYADGEEVAIDIEPPPISAEKGSERWSIAATAKSIPELEVGAIEITSGGAGYADEKPITVTVEPPPATARVNMNDPMMAGIINPSEPLPTVIPAERKSFDPDDPNSRRIRVMKEARSGAGGAGGCVGRACYDKPVIAVATVKAERDSYSAFREAEDAASLKVQEQELSSNRAAKAKSPRYFPKVSGTAGGGESGLPSLPGRSSSQLLNLFPAGIGLVYDPTLKRYVVARGEEFRLDDYSQESPRPLDPEFGPRGRSPIERNKDLDADTLLRFVLSGAICCSGAHLILTPIDVAKTKIQTNPERYPGVISALKTVAKEEGFGTFFNGWEPTFLGFFVNGGLGYSTIEYFRRTFIEMAGPNAGALEIPIILGSALISACLGSFTLAPFESVRIRAVAQPDYADNIVGVLKRIVAEEGAGSLFSAVPAFLPKEILFICTKFLIFDLSTDYLYETYPAANEDLKLSLLISLVGGTLGGVGAAIVSNPADATISEMKKSKSDINAIGAFQALLERGGIPLLFRGLGLRMFFYALIVSIQFLVYDYVRFTLNIGSDDLKLYLDVLGGALSESGGPV